MKRIAIAVSLLFLTAGMAQTRPDGPLAHTYSIVAIDTVTGEIGAAVQSHWFSVGTIVIWARAGVGAVATQSFVNPAYGPQGLALMEMGVVPDAALKVLVDADEGRAFRQVGMINASGKAVAHTGGQCIPAAGHLVGSHNAIQANMMEKASVWPAMERTFLAAEGPLAERLLAALKAAEAEGGDIRGRQSAALLVVRGEATGRDWEDRLVDIRVDDHDRPLEELERLLTVHRAYAHMNAGDVAIEKGDVDGALREYGAARRMQPDNVEMQYWHAVSLANLDRMPEALPLFGAVFGSDARWRELTRRIADNGILTVSEADLAAILKQ